MADGDLFITLTYVKAMQDEIHIAVESDLDHMLDTKARVVAAEDRADAILEQLELKASPRSVQDQRPALDQQPTPDWDEVLRRAREFAQTHDEPFEAPDEDIDRRFTDGWTVAIKLDRCDLAAAVAAGVTAALLDYLLVAVPNESALTNALRELSTSHDNWLSAIAKVPYDGVAGVPIDGFSPMAHRVQTFGHDPLLGWVYGTLDILRGSLSGVSRQGVAAVIDTAVPTTDSVMVALAMQAMHLVSDIVTPAGLPLPGWTALLAADAQLPGARHSIPEFARFMYVRGYDTWHFPAMATPLVAIDVVLRGYLWLRQLLDDDYRGDLDVERARIGSDKVADLPRHQTMTLIARSIAAAGNAGRFVLSGANPLTINSVLWLGFARSVLSSLNRVRPESAMIATAHTNRILLDAAWVQIKAQGFPAIDQPLESDPG